MFYSRKSCISFFRKTWCGCYQNHNYLNPARASTIITVDQPLIAKCIQWTWPQTLVDIEMCIWDTIGYFWDGFGRTSALCEAGVATTGMGDSFLKASNLTRTRRAHLNTALVVSKLRNKDWKSSDENTYD